MAKENEGNNREDLLKAQYNEMWESKRFHTNLCWQISALLGVLANWVLNSHLPKNRFVSFLGCGYILGGVFLFLRHNAFQGVITYLLTDLEKGDFKDWKEEGILPKTGDELFCYAKKKKYKFFHIFLKKFMAWLSWILISIAFVVYLWYNYSNSPRFNEFQ